jgi:hypothetical protein
MARRLSLQNESGSGIFGQSMTVLESQLEVLAKRLRSDCTELQPELVESWKKRCFELSKGVATLREEMNAAKSAIKDETDRQQPNENAEVNNSNAVLERINQKITQSSKSFNPNGAPVVKKIQGILRLGQSDEEEDVLVEENEDQEQKYKCPYTTLKMEDPYTKYECFYCVFLFACFPFFK